MIYHRVAKLRLVHMPLLNPKNKFMGTSAYLASLTKYLTHKTNTMNSLQYVSHNVNSKRENVDFKKITANMKVLSLPNTWKTHIKKIINMASI